ncbi:hypothetical protein EJB05_11922 [Eragrostis curvula]|uniref:Uncharacterized protein n=1 Tax=Eragrostis curvula TaxID=38414 RepID=A0A5J9VSQ3_9POAL|nr:hypothetical protein EJB05_11922 [Eragrostis curvula]
MMHACPIAAPSIAAPAPNELQCRRLRFATLLAVSPTSCSGLVVPLSWFSKQSPCRKNICGEPRTGQVMQLLLLIHPSAVFSISMHTCILQVNFLLQSMGFQHLNVLHLFFFINTFVVQIAKGSQIAWICELPMVLSFQPC